MSDFWNSWAWGRGAVFFLCKGVLSQYLMKNFSVIKFFFFYINEISLCHFSMLQYFELFLNPLKTTSSQLCLWTSRELLAPLNTTKKQLRIVNFDPGNSLNETKTSIQTKILETGVTGKGRRRVCVCVAVCVCVCV